MATQEPLTPAERAALERRMARYQREKGRAMKRPSAAAAPRTPRPSYQRPTYRVSRGLQWFGIIAFALGSLFSGGLLLIPLAIVLAIVGLPNRAPCPHCRGRVKLGVTVCRHCGRDITWT